MLLLSGSPGMPASFLVALNEAWRTVLQLAFLNYKTRKVSVSAMKSDSSLRNRCFRSTSYSTRSSEAPSASSVQTPRQRQHFIATRLPPRHHLQVSRFSERLCLLFCFSPPHPVFCESTCSPGRPLKVTGD